jgi:CheY-like chemotaxis protein
MSLSQTSIYVFYSEASLLEIVESLLCSLFANVTPINVNSEQNKVAQALSAEHTSILFIFAFEDVDDAERLVTLVRGHSAFKNQEKVPSFDVLLCEKSHRLEAYELCERNRFYTYEIIKPFYDANRLKLTLRRLAEHLQSDVDLLKKAENNLELFDTLSQSIDSIKLLQDDVESQLSQQQKEFDELTTPLDHLLQHVPGAEWEKALTTIIKSLPESMQRSSDGHFSISEFRKKLGAYKHSSSASLLAFSSMLETIEPHLASDQPVVIVADDQPVMQKIIATILEPRGFKAELASNGVEAIMKAKVMLPKVILLDIDMTIMDGIATLKAIKHIEAIKTIPVIMLTSHADKDMIQTSVESGASDYVVKPTRADLLLKKIAKVMN